MHQPNLPTESDGAISSLKALVRELIIARLPSSTSSQLDLIRELEVAVIGHRTELESCVVPMVVAGGGAPGGRRDTPLRDEPPPPPLPLPLSMHPLRVPAPPRPLHGTVTHIAGEAYEGFFDGPAFTARFRVIGGIVATDGVLYLSDMSNHRTRLLHHKGGSPLRYSPGDSDVAQFYYCRSVALCDSQGHLLVADFINRRIRSVATNGTTTTLAAGGWFWWSWS